MKFEEYLIESEIDNLKKELKDSDGYLKASNGKDSKLSEKEWLMVRTKSFKKWFGDWENEPEKSSKVVDSNGEPLVTYHGGSKITTFDKSKIGSNYHESVGGFFFTDKKSSAEKYAKLHGGDSGHVTEAFLNIRESYNMNSMDYWDAVEKFDRNAVDIMRDVKFDNLDGVISKSSSGSMFVVVEPNNIKSIKNKGSFSSKSNDINESEK